MTDRSARRGLMIAAPHSGSGKTVVTLALLRAMKQAGIDIAGAKAGPDYIDPGFHSVAAGRNSVNLDPWAMSPERIRMLAARGSGSHLLVEAMMGLFDAAGDGKGSAADLAVILDIPVLLVIDAGRMSHSVAALAKGFSEYRRDLKMAGVILNRVGSDRHEAMLRSALDAVSIPVAGSIRKDGQLELPERHLGLVQAGEHGGIGKFIEAAGQLFGMQFDLAALAELFAPMRHPSGNAATLPPLGNVIAVASDRAFSFCYPHMLDDWRSAGAAIDFFSPLANEGPPADCDAVFLPGGYPELHAGPLAAADNFRSAMHRKAQEGALIYGECGGYMALGEGLEDKEGKRHRMCGLLALETSYAAPRRHLGYRRLKAPASFAMGRSLSGHEFHYSTATREDGDPLFEMADASGHDLGSAGLRKGNVMGSYLHVIDGADR